MLRSFEVQLHEHYQVFALKGLRLNSELEWYWSRARSRPVDDRQFASRPSEVLLTPVNAQSINNLIDDFRERDVDGCGRSIQLIAWDRHADIRSAEALRSALDTFTEYEQGPLRMVVIQVGDSPEYIFVPHDPAESVSDVLEELGVASAEVDKKPYERLNMVRLGLLNPSIIKLAFGRFPLLIAWLDMVT